MATEDLPARRERFVLEYVKCLNGTQAAIRAGYAAETANREASRLLSNADVQSAIAAEKEKYAQLVKVEAYQIIRELAAIVAADATQFTYDRKTGHVIAGPELPPDATKAISSVERKIRYGKDGREEHEVRLRFYSRLEAIKLLNEYLGLFSKQGGETQVPYKVYLGFDPREVLCQPPATSPPPDAPTPPKAPPSD